MMLAVMCLRFHSAVWGVTASLEAELGPSPAVGRLAASQWRPAFHSFRCLQRPCLTILACRYASPHRPVFVWHFPVSPKAPVHCGWPHLT